MSDLLNDLLAVPTSSHKPKRMPVDKDYTSQIEVTSSSVNVTLNDEPGKTTEGTAREFLEREGLDPDAWEVTSFAKSEWGDSDNPKESVKFTFKPRTASVEASKVDIEELVRYLDSHEPSGREIFPVGDLIVGIGDLQLGKMDGDGPEGTLHRTIGCIDEVAAQAALTAHGHIHVAWLGDHIEGFNSQGGANVWRTSLTLTEQIRLTRKVMAYAMQRLRPHCDRLSMAAVPGNHGETLRISGKTATRYDDNHDTDALVAVAEAAALSESYKDVEFYVPDNDELTVLVEVGGVNVLHAHGHQWRPNKHFEWWSNQAFSPKSSAHLADILLSGHLHHSHVEANGRRLFVGVPSLESESTWFRHTQGSVGYPGVLQLHVEDGEVASIDFVRAKEADDGSR